MQRPESTWSVILMVTLLTACDLERERLEEVPNLAPAIAMEHPADDALGFKPMFNGVDLAGWRTTGNWVYDEEGNVTLRPRPGEEGWRRYDAYLFTAKQYTNFILDLEFRIDTLGNSGVFFCVANTRSPISEGIELQILNSHELVEPGHHDCGGIIHAMAPATNMAKPASEWNRYTLTLKDRQLQVVFNGHRTIQLDLDKSPMHDRPAKGYIGFQDEAMPVWFRNVRIRELE